ncbi:MAG: polyphosphate polymerase domain-containing protein [Chloroflexota bacterium]
MRIKYFNRYELKYVIPKAQQADIAEDLQYYTQVDGHSHTDGRYLITSLYFDSPGYKAYHDKIEGHRFRRKVRLRVYGSEPLTPDQPCFAEIKQRANKSLQKKRIYIPYQAAEQLCQGDSVELDFESFTDTDQSTYEEIAYLARTLRLQPACIVQYQRAAFNGGDQDPGLRITFDTNLKCRIHALSLQYNHQAENHYFLPPDWCVMEVKVNQRVPYWLSEVLGKHRCTLRRVSKYCLALEKARLNYDQPIILPDVSKSNEIDR